jgi:hypothetical protein
VRSWVAQIAGSLVLLIVAGLFVRNLQQAQRVNFGFDPNAVTIAASIPRTSGTTGSGATAFYKELDQRVHAIPGVVSASQSFTVPLSWIFGGYLALPKVRRKRHWGAAADRLQHRDAEYFETMKIPVVAGRGSRAVTTKARRAWR